METISQVIELTDNDLKVCTEFVRLHVEEVKKYNLGTTYGLQCNATELFQIRLQGYLGERAVGKYFDYETQFVPYSSLPKQDRPADVLGYEVRTVKYESALLLTHHDDKQCMYICVSIPSNTMTATLKGWSHLNDTLQTKYWRKFYSHRDGCYSVPEENLYQMDCLPETPELIAHRQGLQS